MSSSVDLYNQFGKRLERLLEDLRRDAMREREAIVAKAIATSGRGGAMVAGQLRALESQTRAAIDFAFAQVDALPGTQSRNRDHLSSDIRGHLANHLSAMADQIQFDATMAGVAKEVANTKARLGKWITDEVDDFVAGLWSPGKPTLASKNTTNTLNVQGSLHGSVQQAGDFSIQSATISLDQRAVKVALNDLAEAVGKSALSENARSDALATITTIGAQIDKPAGPNRTILQAAISDLRSLLVGTAANVLSPYVVALLAALGMSAM